MKPTLPLRVRYLPANAAYGVFYADTLIRVDGEPLLFTHRHDALDALNRKGLTT
jgi:hypothetical protein